MEQSRLNISKLFPSFHIKRSNWNSWVWMKFSKSSIFYWFIKRFLMCINRGKKGILRKKIYTNVLVHELCSISQWNCSRHLLFEKLCKPSILLKYRINTIPFRKTVQLNFSFICINEGVLLFSVLLCKKKGYVTILKLKRFKVCKKASKSSNRIWEITRCSNVN